MCGIAGLICKREIDKSKINGFKKATELMNHRGPDHSGHFQYMNCFLYHYRLSILDPDPRSNQPYHSGDNNLVCTYNGEIYNFSELKQTYDIPTITSSDTEIMIESFSKRGKSVVSEWNGIFAMGILNKPENKLYLIRDRFGVKPLYLYEDENYLAFASEIKVLYRWLDSFQLDLQGFSEYLWYGNTISEHTMATNITKLSPGTILTINLNKCSIQSEEKYWKLPQKDDYSYHSGELIPNVKRLLSNAVQRQLVSDVPLGVLLSGGIDSSAIVAFASRHIDKLDTYSVEYDFNIGGENELDNAAMVAKKFRTNHHEMKVSSNDIENIFSELVFQFDDPFSDAANIPLYLLAKACSSDKTVILQGDGGDEFFGGYRRYNILDWINFWKIFSKLSYNVIPSDRWSLRMKRISYILDQNDAMKMALYITEDVPYESPFDILSENCRNKINKYDPFNSYKKFNSSFEHLDIVQRMLYADVHILLNHTYLEKVDKATMFCSMEARVPFLDNELTDYILQLPSKHKVRFGQKKYLLRKALKGIVPDQILNGKKRGFDVPYKTWLKKGLYDFSMSTFEDIENNELLDKDYLLKLMNLHKKGEGNYGPVLWKALVMAHWLKIYRGKIEI